MVRSPSPSPSWAIGCVLPFIRVAVRRLHDTDRSGYWLFMFLLSIVGQIVLLVFFCLKGTAGENRFGPAPSAQG